MTHHVLRFLASLAGALFGALAVKVGLPALGFDLPPTVSLANFALCITGSLAGWYGGMLTLDAIERRQP